MIASKMTSSGTAPQMKESTLREKNDGLRPPGHSTGILGSEQALGNRQDTNTAVPGE